MFWTRLTSLLIISAAANGQKAGSLTDNAILRMPMEECQSEGNCQKGKMFLLSQSRAPLCGHISFSLSSNIKY